MSTHSPSLPQWNSADASTWWSRLQLYWADALAGAVLCFFWSIIVMSGFSRIIDSGLGELFAWGIPHMLLVGLWSSIALYTIWQTVMVLWRGGCPIFDDPVKSRRWLVHRKFEKLIASFLFATFFVSALLVRLLFPESYQSTLREGFMQRDVLEVSCIHFIIAAIAALLHRVWVFVRTIPT